MSPPTRIYPHIIQDPDICFGQPCIEGTRIRVLDIAIEYERLGRSPDQIAESHPGLNPCSDPCGSDVLLRAYGGN